MLVMVGKYHCGVVGAHEFISYEGALLFGILFFPLDSYELFLFLGFFFLVLFHLLLLLVLLEFCYDYALEKFSGFSFLLGDAFFPCRFFATPSSVTGDILGY